MEAAPLITISHVKNVSESKARALILKFIEVHGQEATGSEFGSNQNVGAVSSDIIEKLSIVVGHIKEASSEKSKEKKKRKSIERENEVVTLEDNKKKKKKKDKSSL